MRTRKWLASATMLWACAASAPSAAQTPQLQLVATYSTGLSGDNAEVISIRSDGIAVASNTAGSVDVLDLSNPFAPRRLIRVPVDTTTGTPNSAAVHPQLDYFLTVTGRAGQIGRVSAFGLFSGALLDSAPVGIQPDAVVISPNGLVAVITNEAEASGAGQNGGEGSLSVVDLAASNAAGRLVVRHVALPAIVGFRVSASGAPTILRCYRSITCPRRLSLRTSPSARTAVSPMSRSRRITPCYAWTCTPATCRRLGWD